MIRRAVLQRPDAVLDVTIELWERLAAGLISIIGEGGFDSLYARSIHLAGASFPWLVPGPPSAQSGARFAQLKFCLESQDGREAGEASIALLITFIDILALLIGEPLTTSILRSVWGDGALDMAAKELL